MIGLRSRLAVALLVFGLCLVYALPSVPYIGTALENVLPSKKINLGLDLKGGIHLTLPCQGREDRRAASPRGGQ